MPDYQASPELLTIYLEDARSHLEALDHCLLNLERDGLDPAVVATVLGPLHTLKGNSGMMGFGAIKEYVHRLEDVFSQIADGGIVLTPAHFDQLFAGASALREAVEQACARPGETRDLGPEKEVLDLLLRQAESDSAAARHVVASASPVRPAAHVWVEIGTPVAFWARAEARRIFSMTGVTPAVSVAHLMMAALTPLSPMPCVMSRTNSSATASTPWPLKYRWGIHQTPVATITWTRERRATSRIRPMSRPRSTVVRSTIARMPRAWRSAIFPSAIARIPARSQRCGQFSCTPGERVTMCSCISVAPSSEVAIEPSAVSTVVVMAISSRLRASSRHRAQEALDLGLVVVVVDARAHEGVEPARGQIQA